MSDMDVAKFVYGRIISARCGLWPIWYRPKQKENMAGEELENINPTVYGRQEERVVTSQEEDDDIVDEIDDREVFDILCFKSTY